MREPALIVHVIGVVLWIGGAALAAWTAAQLALAPKESRGVGLAAVRKAMLAIAAPGILLAFLGGIAMFVADLDLYARAGWLHGKITVALGLAALHGVLGARIRKAASGEREATSGFFAGIAMAIVIGAAIATALVILRPGA